jgi:glycerate 2-kinase
MLVKNYEDLTSHGNMEGRRIVLDIIEAGLKAADPYPNIRKMVRIEDGNLLVGHKSYAVHNTVNAELPLIFDLSKVGNVYLFGGGKAVQRMAQAVEDSLGDMVIDGQINAKKGDALRCKKVNVTFAGHPIPDEDSVVGAKRKHEIESKVKKGDIVFYLLQEVVQRL